MFSCPIHESPDIHKQEYCIAYCDSKACHPCQTKKDPGGIGPSKYKEPNSVFVPQQINGEQAKRHRKPVQAPVSEKVPHVQPNV